MAIFHNLNLTASQGGNIVGMQEAWEENSVCGRSWKVGKTVFLCKGGVIFLFGFE